MKKDDIGRMGEVFAAKYLEDLGFTVIGTNIRAGHLETDIIACNDKYILFTEVKTRRLMPNAPHPFGTPGAAVTPAKADRLIRAAEAYMREHRNDTAELQPRIDVIEIYADPASKDFSVLSLSHVKNAVKRTSKI